MQIKDLGIYGAKLIEFKEFKDERGSFAEIFNLPNFNVAQVNRSVSKRGVLRGIHIAEVPPGQAKYVTCISGSIFDVLVDLRKSSPTFKQWLGVEISDRNNVAVSIPAGVGHGFLSLEENSTVIYLCDQKYNPQNEFELDAFDHSININWPEGFEFLQSDKDKKAPSLSEIYDRLPK